jgi:hypothetical protein
MIPHTGILQMHTCIRPHATPAQQLELLSSLQDLAGPVHEHAAPPRR